MSWNAIAWRPEAILAASIRIGAILVAGSAMSWGTAVAAEPPAEQKAAARPNIVLIQCDDLGYGDLGCYGHPSIRTPNLDRMAKEGLRFTDCYAAAPVCSSSRAGFHTGRTPSRIGVYDWIPQGHPIHLKAGEITIATQLKQAGYTTCLAGKWHLNGIFNRPEQPQPHDHGFGHWLSTQNNAAPSHQDPTNFVRNGTPIGKQEGFSCRIMAREAIEWMEKGRLSQNPDPAVPFFLTLAFHEPHEPVASPEDLVRSYPNAKSPDQAQYFANVTNLDAAVGEVLAALDRLGQTERTVVFFTSDNGPETLNRYAKANRSHGSPGPLRGMKLHIYDGGIRVPGIVRWPGTIRPGVSREPICGVDIFPTCCELAGVPLPSGRKYDGTGLAGLWRGEPLKREKPLFWHYYRSISEPKAALRAGDWKIVGRWDGPKNPPGANVGPAAQDLLKTAKLVSFELYRIADDPAESRDLAAEEPQRLAEMKAQLIAAYEDVLAEAPRWDIPAEAKPAKSK